MIVGFTIVDFKEHFNEALNYIAKVFILDDVTKALSILSAADEVNVFTSAFDVADLAAQVFDSKLIFDKEDKVIVASTANYLVELPFNDTTIHLTPTQYLYVSREEVAQFIEPARMNLVRVIPNIIEGNSTQVGIFDTGYWNDNGVWLDDDFWRY